MALSDESCPLSKLRDHLSPDPPKSLAASVTFISSNLDRAVVNEESRVDGSEATTVSLRITGISKTPTDKPNGDAYVQARFRNNPIGERIPVVIVVPATQTHTVNAVSLTNIANPGTGPDGTGVTEIRTSVDATATITIKDQFGQTLDAVYDGDNVVTERFFNTTEQGLPQPQSGPALSLNEIPITEPDSTLKSGVKLDAISINTGTLIPGNFNPVQIQGWQNGTLFLVTADGRFNNVFSFTNTHVILKGTQLIQVHGYLVSPNYVRSMEATPTNHPPVPFTATDVAAQTP